jgi:hypothetical protein
VREVAAGAAPFLDRRRAVPPCGLASLSWAPTVGQRA